MTAETIDSSSGARVAFHHTPGVEPGVLFCTGFRSDMTGGKALALEHWCRREGRQFTRFDYGGHGASSGRFEDGTIGAWLDDALCVLDRVCDGPQVVVGSSMGGWMMLLLALARPQRIAGLLGIASAPDFTRTLLEQRLSPEQHRQLEQTGYCEVETEYDDGQPYRIGRTLLQEADAHLLLDGPIPIGVPVRLIHGRRDIDVPWERSLALVQQLESADVELQLVKEGGHRLSEPADLQRMLDTLRRLLGSLDPTADGDFPPSPP
jgi:pimeloyl-ACP methyl ester carboxylesterase